MNGLLPDQNVIDTRGSMGTEKLFECQNNRGKEKSAERHRSLRS